MMPVLRKQKSSNGSVTESSAPVSITSKRSGSTSEASNGELGMSDEPLFGSTFDDIHECCSPLGCGKTAIDSNDPDPDAVKFLCSNEYCHYSRFMHGDCFNAVEEMLVTQMKQSSRTKSWNDKQRRQAVWRKGCECRCKKGTLKKDTSYVPSIVNDQDTEKKKRRSKKHDKIGMPTVVKASSYPRQNGFALRRTRCRNSDSQSSDGGGASAGNSVPSSSIAPRPFLHRSPNDYEIFSKYLPKALTNSYHIKMEDDGYGAGDDTRSFVLTTLASSRLNSLTCVLCSVELKVYDRYPLVNGTLYLTPNQASESCIHVESKAGSQHSLYLSAVCLLCLSGHNKVTCNLCSTTWQGNMHQVGTMYSYDLFAAMPCCQGRTLCKDCGKPVLDTKQPIKMSFWQMSQQVECPHCSAFDFHLVKSPGAFTVDMVTPKD